MCVFISIKKKKHVSSCLAYVCKSFIFQFPIGNVMMLTLAATKQFWICLFCFIAPLSRICCHYCHWCPGGKPQFDKEAKGKHCSIMERFVITVNDCRTLVLNSGLGSMLVLWLIQHPCGHIASLGQLLATFVACDCQMVDSAILFRVLSSNPCLLKSRS